MVVVVLVACGWLLLVGGGVFLGEVKARRKDIISFSLDYQKQKLSTTPAVGRQHLHTDSGSLF